MKITLYDSLMAQSLRTIEAISRARAFPFDTHASKAKSARRLADLLLRPNTVRAAWKSLSDEARGALRDLARRPDPIPREDFIYRYGEFRPHKPWRDDAPRRPWLEPISPAERLLYSGLVLALNLGTSKRPLWVIALPDEIRAALAGLLPLPPAPRVSPPTSPQSRSQIDRQVFTLLSFLNTRDVQALWGRWLPPKMAQGLIERLALLAYPEPFGGDDAPIRSELAIPRLTFIHYLAERAGLLDISGAGRYLKPTLLVKAWLSTPPARRIETLWNAWLKADKAAGDLWRRYRLPTVGDDDPLARLRGLIRALKMLPLDEAVPLDAFLDELSRDDPALLRPDASYAAWEAIGEYGQENYCGLVRSCLEKILGGPLAWFGAVRVEGIVDDPAAPLSVSLTPLGATLLQREAEEQKEPPAQAPAEASLGAPLRLALEEKENPAITIHASADTPLPALWSLEEMAELVKEKPGRYALSRRSFLRALDRGHTVEGITAQLEGDSGDALSPGVLHLLYNWAEAHGQITLRPAMILQTRDPALLQELASAKRVRDKFTATLSARAVTVDASALDLLVRQLEKRGLHATVERFAFRPAPQPEAVSAADRVAIVAALRLAQHLSREAGLRQHLPYPLVRDWEASLSLPERDAAASWVSRVLDRLPRRYYRPEGDYRPPFPVEPLLPVLKEAIATGATVEIEYHAFERPITTRRVDPLRLEQWGKRGRDYLIAFCHLRGEERTFRVDRIAQVEPE